MANEEGVLLKVTQHFVQKGLIVLAFWFGRRQVQRLTSRQPGALDEHWIIAHVTLFAAVGNTCCTLQGLCESV